MQGQIPEYTFFIQRNGFHTFAIRISSLSLLKSVWLKEGIPKLTKFVWMLISTY